jgi:ribosomal protein L1
MTTKGKNYRAAAARVERRPYALEDAIGVVKDSAFAKFDETVEVSMRLGVNPRHADQMVRGTVVLPHGTGKTRRVLAVCEGPAQKQAEEAGADLVLSGDDAVAKIQGGWLEFDAMVATPDMMRALSKVGRVLGPRGLMPNPKSHRHHPRSGRQGLLLGRTPAREHADAGRCRPEGQAVVRQGPLRPLRVPLLHDGARGAGRPRQPGHEVGGDDAHQRAEA